MHRKTFVQMIRFGLLTLSCFGFLAARAQTTVLEEHFDWPAGALIRDHGWYAHSAATTNPLAVSAPGLFWTQTTYRGSGQGLSVTVSNTGSDENRPFSTSLDSGLVYGSFLFRIEGVVDSSAEGYFFHFAEYNSVATPVYTSVASAHRARTFLVRGDDPSTFRLGLTFNSASIPGNQGVDLTAPLDTGVTYLAVLKYEMVLGADNDRVSLFIFEDGDSIRTEPTTATLGPLSGTARDLTAVQGIALRQYSASQRVRVDGLHCASNWNLLSGNPGTSVAPNASINLRAYPNPAIGGKLRIEFPQEQSYTIQLLGIEGHNKQEWITNASYHEIDEMASGFYILRVQTQDGQTAHQKIWVP
ncbi:MAG: T9SS type A sorting domain-containing protein [Bacteroidia bacterium]|jgi:hypothetical protein